jgi:hypothetical protein
MGIDARSRGRQARKSVGRSGMAYNENLEVRRRQVSKRPRDQCWLIAKFGSRKVRGTVAKKKHDRSVRKMTINKKNSHKCTKKVYSIISLVSSGGTIFLNHLS